MEYKLIVFKPKNHIDYVIQCLEIARQNHVDNGGTLRYATIVQNSKYLICAVKDNKVLGYAGMVEDFVIENDFYIYQIAIDKNYAGKGIGTNLMEFIKTHSKGYSYITSSVRKNNKISNKLHKKSGFEKFDINEDEYVYFLPTQYIKNNNKIKFIENEEFFSLN